MAVRLERGVAHALGITRRLQMLVLMVQNNTTAMNTTATSGNSWLRFGENHVLAPLLLLLKTHVLLAFKC